MSIKSLQQYALSEKDIKSALNNKVKIVSLSEVKKMKHINELLGPYKACVFLYETKDNYGHWCCIFEVNESLVEFFDPYGMMIDNELKYIPKSYLHKKQLNHTFVGKLLYESHYQNIEWNNYPLQELKKDMNTCGRHVVVRLLNRNLTLDEYYDKIKKSGYDPDTYVTLITKNIY